MTAICSSPTLDLGVFNAAIGLRWRPTVALTLRIGPAPGLARHMMNISVVSSRISATTAATTFAIFLFDFTPRFRRGLVKANPFMTAVWPSLSLDRGNQNAPITLRMRPAVALTLWTGCAIGPASIVMNILGVGHSPTFTPTTFAIALFDFFPRIFTG